MIASLKFNSLLTIVCLGVFTATYSQDSLKVSKPTFQFKNGIGVVVPDSLFSLNFRFRLQTRAAYFSTSADDLSASAVEARVRRLRLRFEGFVLNPKFNYSIQLSFSRGDMDWDDRDNSIYNTSPNIVRDAIVFYKPNKNWNFIFGQTKLPGNRQRVISSGEQQFAERSIVNATFTADRDFGTQIHYSNSLGKVAYVLKGAITTGEGRNSSASDAGLAYTSRIELMPFGKFTNKGDYFEGDLEREEKPKLSLAAGYNYNEGAVRSGGTLGKDLYAGRNLGTFMADMLLKYKGIAFSSEFLSRQTSNPITISKDGKSTRYVYVGNGMNTQLSYCFKSKLEIAARYAIITPERAIQAIDLQKEEIGMGVSKYLNRHRIKVQGNVFYLRDKDVIKSAYTSEKWHAVFQVELGI